MSNAFGVIPTYEERARLRWDALFADDDDRGQVADAMAFDDRHYTHGGWQIDGSDLICECGETLRRLYAVTP